MYYNLSRYERADEEGFGGESAVNPIIVPALLTVFAITLAVVTASWMGGLTGRYPVQENLEIINVTCALDDHGNWEVFVTLENRGSPTLTMSKIFVNDSEASAYGAVAPVSSVDTITTGMETGIVSSIAPSECVKIAIWIGAKHSSLKPGTNVDIKIRCSSGADIVAKVRLV